VNREKETGARNDHLLITHFGYLPKRRSFDSPQRISLPDSSSLGGRHKYLPPWRAIVLPDSMPAQYSQPDDGAHRRQRFQRLDQVQSPSSAL